jgi:hypothetical protein
LNKGEWLLFNLFKKKSAEAPPPKKRPSYLPDPNRILFSCDFNDSLCGWVVRGPAWQEKGDTDHGIKLSLTTETKHSGNSCLKISGRYANWHGASVNVAKYVKESIRNYEAMVWVKVPDGAPSCKIYLSLETNSQLGGVVFPYYEQFEDFDPRASILSKYRLPVNGEHDPNEADWETAYPENHATDDGWVLLHGKVQINRAEHFRAFIYIESNNQGANNDIYIDDFVLMRGL